MLRNFSSSNSLPSMPHRRWRYSTGPGEVSQTSRAATIITGTATNNAKSPQARSKTRFAREHDHALSASAREARAGVTAPATNFVALTIQVETAEHAGSSV